MSERPIHIDDGSLVDLLDRLLNVGVVAAGDVVLGLADVDLIRLNLRLVLASVEALTPAAHAASPDADRLAPSPTPGNAGDRHASDVRGPALRGLGASGTQAAQSRAAGTTAPPSHAAHGATARTADWAPGPTLAVADRLERRPSGGSAEDRSDLGLGGLLLAVIEIVRQLLERQALHRMQAGSLTADQVERLGQALMQLEQRVQQLGEIFGRPAEGGHEAPIFSTEPLTRR